MANRRQINFCAAGSGGIKIKFETLTNLTYISDVRDVLSGVFYDFGTIHIFTSLFQAIFFKRSMKFNKTLNIIIYTAVILLMTASPKAFADDLEKVEIKLKNEQKKLNSLKRQIKKNRRAITKREKKEKTLLSEIQRSNDDISLMNQELKIYEWNLLVNNKKKSKNSIKLTGLYEKLDEKNNILGKRLKNVYKNGSRLYLKSVFSAGDLTKALQRIKYISKITEYDYNLINDFKKKINSLIETKKRLSQIEEEILLYKKNTQIKKNELRKHQSNRAKLLNKIKNKKELLKRASKELEKSRKGLKDLIAGLDKKKHNVAIKLPDFARKKGKLLWPAYGKVIKKFGKVKDRKLGAILFNNGVDIAAKSGSEIKSVFDGEVIFADRLEGYGQMLILDHGGSYYSVYGHLTRLFFKVGDIVTEGSPLGSVESKVAFNEQESLYFEIRYKGKPENPRKWLK